MPPSVHLPECSAVIDVIAPLGLLLILAILGVIVWAARRQRQIRRGLLADYAETRALTYLAEDDGRVETAAQGFEGFARFRSASLGRVKPAPVVEGSRGHLRFFDPAHQLGNGMDNPSDATYSRWLLRGQDACFIILDCLHSSHAQTATH